MARGRRVHNIEVAVAIVLSIGISYRLKINTGLLAIAFSYIIGVFLMGMTPADVTALWPVTIFFQILAVTLFFAVAIENGTLEKISQRMLYGARGLAWGLALVFFATALVVAALGAGFYAVMVFLAPAAILIATRVKIEPMLAGLAVIVGAQVGSNFPTSLNGVVFRGLFESLKFSSSKSLGITWWIFLTYFVVTLVVISTLTLIFRRKAARSGVEAQRERIEVDKPAPFDRSQRITLGLIAVYLLLALGPSVLHVLFKSVGLFGTWDNNIDPPLLAVTLTAIALLFGVGDSRKVIDRVPWHILLMISGVGMLIQVGIKAGAITDLAKWLSNGDVPKYLVPLALAFVAAIITCFSSYIGVTAPALFPIVPTIASVTHLSPTLMFVCATVGGLSMAISPYSEGGAMVMSFSPEDQQDSMYRKELTVGLPAMGIAALVAALVLTLIVR